MTSSVYSGMNWPHQYKEINVKTIKQGARAFRFPKFATVNGYTVVKGNPYKVDTEEHRQWEQGYNEAYFKNLDRIKKRENLIKP